MEEAQALQLLAMDRLLRVLNAHEKIQPFLEVIPLTYERAEICIRFRGPLGPYADGSILNLYARIEA